MKRLRTAVIGAGYLGRFHAHKYAQSPQADLVAVVDVDHGRAAAVAAETGARPYTDYRPLLDQLDAVSVVVPTSQHYSVGRELLAAGVHVLMEKPIAADPTDAAALVALAAAHGVVLQVGHLERFNPVIQALLERVDTPMFIEAHRLAPYSARGIDVDVVLDLMIHDLDLMHLLVDAPVTRIDASGMRVLSEQIDIANARVAFANGCVANLTASRVSRRPERRLRVFQKNAYLAADMCNQALDSYRRVSAEATGRPHEIDGHRELLSKGDPLREEITAFLSSVQNGVQPRVSGADGARALETALEVVRQITQSGTNQRVPAPLAVAYRRAQP